jgi:CzcA family heavy metal efflux pump
MLDRLIRACLDHRLVVLALAAMLLGFGSLELARRPVDIFPDLNQPIVTVLADVHGYAPDEIETQVTLPLEAALVGISGVERIRSTSQEGLSIVRVEFGWGTDVYRDRQLVQERMQLAARDLPPGTDLEIAPISSITGVVMDLGLVSPDGSVSQLELQSLAEWVVRRRVMAVRGVSQVVVIGGKRRQVQVKVDPDLLIRHGVSLTQVAEAVSEASQNTSGGIVIEGGKELLVRNLGRLQDAGAVAQVVVAGDRRRPVRVGDVAQVVEGPQFPRGAASVGGHPGVVLEVFKQPEADTLALTQAIDDALKRIRPSLPEGAELRADLFRQSTFLQRGVNNVIGALRDGAVLVVIILLIFLMHLRASLVTLVALPLSFATAGILFSVFDLTLNTMTLGGLAIAVGELVDDAIVGVENVLRRLRLGRPPDSGPDWYSCLVADASSEVRGPIFSGTLVVVLVFVPLFALSGIEGRLFTPLAVAYVVSLLASMLVSLTVTPVLALMLFRKDAIGRVSLKPRPVSPVLKILRRGAGALIGAAVRFRHWVLAGSAALVLVAGFGAWSLGSQFLPEFDEGTVMILLQLPPGTSLVESDRLAWDAERRLEGLEGVVSVSRFTGRGEHDEHAPPPGISHLMLTLDPEAGIGRELMIERVRKRLAPLAGAGVSVGQPLAHRIDHLLTGVQAQIVVKASGPDMAVLRRAARQVAGAARGVSGVTDLYIEPQVLVDQVHIRPKLERVAELGLTPGGLAHELELAVGGEVVGHLLRDERSIELFVRLKEDARASIESLRQLPIRLPAGGWSRLGELAAVERGVGPNAISRDHLTRRVAVSCNAQGRSIGEVVADLKAALEPIEAALPEGHFLRFEGQFKAQQDATRLIGMLSLLALLAMILILYGQFRSLNLAFQVLTCVPMAFTGGVAFLLLTGQNFSVAALVGFVSLAGIATRNGILLVSHYLNLAKHGEPVDPALLIRAGQERAAPVVMTALTTGVGLLPLLLSAGETGREILYPVATVVIGGLLTSTLFEFLLRPALFWTLGRKVVENLTGPSREC